MDIAFGNNIKLNIYGASHAEKIGMKLEGIPAGIKVDLDELQAFLKRRAPGNNAWSTPRKEKDIPEFISGLEIDSDSSIGTTNGCLIEAVIRNTNVRSQDYENVRAIPRPAHADYAAWVKNGKIEAGGGKWSARMTAPLCIAGGIAKQILAGQGIQFVAHIYRIGDVVDQCDSEDAKLLEDFPAFLKSSAEGMKAIIADAKSKGDSIGGIVECRILGVPAGIGDALFGGIENRLSQAIFAVPAVKGIEFGNGFDCANVYGSQNNDPFIIDEETGKVVTKTNNHGGILGGISSGMPIVFRVAFKPTPSIALEQDSVDLIENKPAKLIVKGRHDPCIVPRAVPCVEAAAAIAILDMVLGNE